MNISTDLFSATISESPRQSQPDTEVAQPTNRVVAAEKPSSAKSGGANDTLLASAQQFKQSGASDEEVVAFVNSELDAADSSESPGSQRIGQFVDMYS